LKQLRGSRRKVRVANRVQCRYRGLSNRGVRVTHQVDQRVERGRVADARQRERRGDGEFGIGERVDQRGRGAFVANPAERDRRGLSRAEIFSAQLFDQWRDDPAAIPDERLHDLGPHVLVAEQPRERTLNRLAFQPRQHLRETWQPIGIRALDRVKNLLRAGGADAAPDQRRNVIARAVLVFVAVVQTGQRVGDDFGRRRGRIEHSREGLGDILVTDFTERFDRRRAQHFIGQERHEARRNRRGAKPAERLNRRKRQKEIALFGDGDERVARLRGVQPPERFDDVKANVDVRVREVRHQRGNRAVIAPLARESAPPESEGRCPRCPENPREARSRRCR
jgi:hypothetical protein